MDNKQIDNRQPAYNQEIPEDRMIKRQKPDDIRGKTDHRQINKQTSDKKQIKNSPTNADKQERAKDRIIKKQKSDDIQRRRLQTNQRQKTDFGQKNR